MFAVVEGEEVLLYVTCVAKAWGLSSLVRSRIAFSAL
jgi:hypothetical protein